MAREWRIRRKTRALASDVGELIQHVTGRYAELLEKHGGITKRATRYLIQVGAYETLWRYISCR